MADQDIDFETARDLINGRFLEQFDADAQGIVGKNGDLPEIYWDNVSGSAPEKVTPWIRVNTQHTSADQSSLGAAGGRIFSRDGIVTVQIFVPAGARGLTLADRLGKMAMNAFEGRRAGGVWFRGVKLNEVGPDGPWYQYNVTANFTYDQTK